MLCLRVFTDVARGFGNVLPLLLRPCLLGCGIGFFGNTNVVFLRIHACNAGGRCNGDGGGFGGRCGDGFRLVDWKNGLPRLKHIFCLCKCRQG